MRVFSIKVCGWTSVQILHHSFITAYSRQRFNHNAITLLLGIEKLHRGSNISAHDLLNLLNELVNKSMNVSFYLSYGIKITLKSQFLRKNVIILSSCTS